MSFQVLGISDATEHQQLRRSHGACAQNHLTFGHVFLRDTRGLTVKATTFLGLRGGDGLHSHHLCLVEQQPHSHLVADQLQSLSGCFVLRCLRMHQGFQVAFPGAGSFAIRRDRHIHRSKAFLLEPVHVICPGIASLLPRQHKGLVDGFYCFGPSLRHRQGARTSTVGGLASLMTLSFAVVGQDVPVGPGITTFANLLRPAFVV
mmetsp:Transcript_77522/g.171242  ORF Transcript_77522/g.171242 Transcript_77522/m.171242 type:complete len:204 (-) Transcript_77522:388-999(-)